jgi:ribosomal-protein-alanine N-acetyltransferase
MIPFLETPRLLLCPFGEWMLQSNYVKWLNDPEVQRSNSHGRFPYTLEQAKSWLNHKCSANESLNLALVHKTEHIHIGNIALQDIDYLNQSADFAIMLGEKAFWGQGLALEASQSILRHGFEQLNLNRISCATSSENVAMQKLAIKLGMSQEGLRKKALFKQGSFHDLIEFGILRT